MERVAVLRTSDRNAYRNCRRNWAWSSHLRNNLTSKGSSPVPLWFGSGIHFALEDYHGSRKHVHPRDAWLNFYQATIASKEAPPLALCKEHKELGVGMLDYYSEVWMEGRDPLRTYEFNGRLCTEVNIEIPLPIPEDKLKAWGWDKAVYSLTLDRVIIDDDGLLWVVEYKTAKTIQTQHFQLDPQVTAYMWAATHVFDKPVQGVIYQQHLKTLPQEPLILRGGKLSCNQQQKTTHALYRKGLEALHGKVVNAPGANVEFLNSLLEREDHRGDPFIRRDKVTRNTTTIKAEGVKIMAEAEEMLNPDTPLYPNPTRDCSWRCPFVSPCISFDDGSNAELEMSLGYEQRKGREDRWRKQLKLQ